jgi:hypothetical protein
MYSSTQQVEDMWDDYFAKGDAIRERYACQIQDARNEEAIYEEECLYRQQVINAGYPDTLEGMDEYEASWKRAFAYAESGAVDSLLR